MRKRLARQAITGFLADRAAGRLHFGRERGIVGWIRDNRHVPPVLGGGAHHGGPADVDVLDGVIERAIRIRDGLHKGIQVHGHKIDGFKTGATERLHVFGNIASRKDARVHLRMQRLDATVEHFREAGIVADLDDWHARLAQQLCRAAR